MDTEFSCRLVGRKQTVPAIIEWSRCLAAPRRPRSQSTSAKWLPRTVPDGFA